MKTIDTHTGGEPTRVVLQSEQAGETVCPGRGPAFCLQWLRDSADWIRQSLVLEPRGCESMVGAYVGRPSESSHTASVVFFNNAGYLGMCGHGLIGVTKAMHHAGMIEPGCHRFETPAGLVTVVLHDDLDVSFENVGSYRHAKDVAITVDLPPDLRRWVTRTWRWKDTSRVCGDVAYGGNWFFIVPVPSLALDDVEPLTTLCRLVKGKLFDSGVRGSGGEVIDHVELSAPLLQNSVSDQARPGVMGGRCFVMCPGGEFDRSPCGTGTSAKVACLADDSKMSPSDHWLQQSIIGSEFSASYRRDGGTIRVAITGQAFVCARTECLFDPRDPYRHGIAFSPRQGDRVGSDVAASSSISNHAAPAVETGAVAAE